jgi:hypothetical protein
VRAEVLDVASQMQLNGVLVNERPKTDPLHNALYADFRSGAFVRSLFHLDQIDMIRLVFYKHAPK